jgi:hypothetical protein
MWAACDEWCRGRLAAVWEQLAHSGFSQRVLAHARRGKVDCLWDTEMACRAIKYKLVACSVSFATECAQGPKWSGWARM